MSTKDEMYISELEEQAQQYLVREVKLLQQIEDLKEENRRLNFLRGEACAVADRLTEIIERAIS